jgi:uncharacterized protein
MHALLATGEVIHTRLKPVRNAFRYGVYFLLLPMRGGFAESALFKRNRFGLLSFYDRDHGDQHANGLAWLDALLAREGITDATGEAWLQCFPRVLGYTFKPVSFWFCHRADGSLRCAVVEVNNTFGERHVYLLDTGTTLVWGQTLTARKVFHVSPFCAVEGEYRFRFLRSAGVPERLVIRIDHSDATGPLLQTSVSGQLTPISDRLALKVFFLHPLMTLGVVARIHWQAARLWFKRVQFYKKPAPPVTFVTKSADAEPK